jgi:hypothetical protein
MSNYAPKIAFYMLAFNLALLLMTNFNDCYECGNNPVVSCPTRTAALSTACPNEVGTGHPFLPGVDVEPMWKQDSMIVDARGVTVNASDFSSYNDSLQSAASYKTAPSGITDIFGFFSWVITGIRLIVNLLFMPLFGVPQFFVTHFWVPIFLAGSMGTLLFIIQLIGIYSFATGREVF